MRASHTLPCCLPKADPLALTVLAPLCVNPFQIYTKVHSRLVGEQVVGAVLWSVILPPSGYLLHPPLSSYSRTGGSCERP